MESDIGLTPNNDGQLIRLSIPELNEERRRELVKVVRHIAEEGRIAIRNVRRDIMHDLRELRRRGRRRRRRRAPRRGRAAEADRRAHRRARRAAQGQGSRDPRGLSAGMEADGGAARYVAIITDGNGRWAQARGLPVVEGHRAGADTVKARLRDAARARHPRADRLLVLDRELVAPGRGGHRAHADVLRADPGRDARAARRGRAHALHRPPRARRRARCSSRWTGPRRETAANDRITLFVAFNYGGRAEILDAAAALRGRRRGAPSGGCSTRPRCTTPT